MSRYWQWFSLHTAVYPAFGKKYLSQAYNKQGELEGSTKIKVSQISS